MPRNQERRDDARPGREGRRGRASSSPAPVAAPLLLAGALVALTTLAALACGLAVPAVLALAAAAAVIAGIAAHRTLSSLVAGLALSVIRPYAPGERLRIYSSAHGCVVEATVVHIGPVNTTLAVDTGLLTIANNRLLKDVPEHGEAPPVHAA